jgi:hypothetical protein
MTTLSIKDIAWFAGLYEGEGMVNIESKKLCPRLHVEMTDRDVIERAARITGGYAYCCKYARRNEKRPEGKPLKPVFRLVIDAQRSIGWMMMIYSFLGERRRERIDAAIRYWRGREKQPGGWTAHRARYGCKCQQNTGSCQKLHIVESLVVVHGAAVTK